MYLHDAAKTQRGTRAAVVGAVAGIIPAIGLGCVRVLNSEPPEVSAELAGNFAFALVYASPYLLALMASRARDPGVRGGLLAAIGLLSILASFSTFSLVSVVLLPATFMLWFAAARSLAVSGRPLATSVPAAFAGLLMIATVALGFFALWGIQDAEDRCWVLTYDSDGHSLRWESRPNVGGPGGLSAGPLSGGPAMVTYDGGVTWQRVGPPVGPRSYCTSDIITNTEAALGMGAVVAALLAMLLVLKRRRLLSWTFRGRLPSKRSRPPYGDAGAAQHDLTQAEETNPGELSRIRKMLGTSKESTSSMAMLSTEGGMPVQQTQLAPEGLEFSEDISPARWIEESVAEWKLGETGALIPGGFPTYARIFHPAYLDGDMEQPVRWSTVASWTGQTVHPKMQFERIARLSEDPKDIYKNPPWGYLPQHGSIPEKECLVLMNVLREFTSTPDRCFFCLWEGYGNIDTRLYKASARVRAPGRDYLMFRGPLDALISFVEDRKVPFWGDSPNIWWPEDRSWCVATDIDLFDTYLGGSTECVEAVLDSPELEALPTTIDARLDLDADGINAPGALGGNGQ